MNINGPDTAFELDLEGIGLALLGGGSYEEAGVEDNRILGAEYAHFS